MTSCSVLDFATGEYFLYVDVGWPGFRRLIVFVIGDAHAKSI